MFVLPTAPKFELAVPKTVNAEKLPQYALAIRARRARLGLSGDELADRTFDLAGGKDGTGANAISQRTISALETGKLHPGNLSAYRLGYLLHALEWTPPEFEEETGVSIQGITDHVHVELSQPNISAVTKRINVYDMVTAGSGEDGGRVIEVIDIPLTWQGEYVGYQISGNSMGALMDGATVIVKSQSYAEAGQLVVCYVPELGMVLKRYVGVLPGNYHLLQSQHPNHKPIWTKELSIKGVVKEVRLAVDTAFPRFL